jgi:hypothetical protein
MNETIRSIASAGNGSEMNCEANFQFAASPKVGAWKPA